MPVVSIIMPLYNIQEYLPETLRCLLRQTYVNYELICINDGSTDATMNILCMFAQKDNRIRIINNMQREEVLLE